MKQGFRIHRRILSLIKIIFKGNHQKKFRQKTEDLA